MADVEIARAQAATSVEELVRWSETAYKKPYDSSSMLTFFWGGKIYGVNKKLGEVPVTAGVDNLFQWLVQNRP